MNKVFAIPQGLIFSPCKVDGEFWSQFHVLISYLGDPESLVSLKAEDPNKYAEVIEPLVRFVSVTETELFEKGHITEVELKD